MKRGKSRRGPENYKRRISGSRAKGFFFLKKKGKKTSAAAALSEFQTNVNVLTKQPERSAERRA